MRPLLSIIFILTFVACKQTTSTQPLVTKDLKYSAYYWHFNQAADSFEFYLVHYVDIDKNGNFVLMRHDTWLGRPKYFKGIINDTLRQLTDTTFSNGNFKRDYTWKVDDGIYDGYTYCFDYSKETNNYNKLIQFIPDKSPPQIKRLAKVLDTLIYHSVINKIDTLDLQDYSKKLEQIWISEHGGRIPKPIEPPPIDIKVSRFKS